MLLLLAKNLSCIRRDRTLFEDLNLALAKSEIMHLKGENGAGKTSLMRILAGLSMPTSGQVFLDNIPLAEQRENFAKASLYIGHKTSISPTLTAIENTKFWMAQHGLTYDAKRVDDTLLVLGLAGSEDMPVAKLSAGQQRRVALARLWLKPTCNIWFLDEPFTALDVNGVELICEKMSQFTAKGGAVLITSHQPLSQVNKVTNYHLEYRF